MKRGTGHGHTFSPNDTHRTYRFAIDDGIVSSAPEERRWLSPPEVSSPIELPGGISSRQAANFHTAADEIWDFMGFSKGTVRIERRYKLPPKYTTHE